MTNVLDSSDPEKENDPLFEAVALASIPSLDYQAFLSYDWESTSLGAVLSREPFD